MLGCWEAGKLGCWEAGTVVALVAVDPLMMMENRGKWSNSPISHLDDALTNPYDKSFCLVKKFGGELHRYFLFS